MATGGSHLSRGFSETNAGEEGKVQQCELLNLLPAPPPFSGVGGASAGFPHPPDLGVDKEATVVTTSRGSQGTVGTFPDAEEQGRAVKAPVTRKRRPRSASRKSPTTVLSTDPYNFRAMVQQFTGAHPVPFCAGTSGGIQTAAVRFGSGWSADSQQHRPQAAAFTFRSTEQQQQHSLNEGRHLFLPEWNDGSSSASVSDAVLKGYVGKTPGGFLEVPDVFRVSSSPDQVMPRAATHAARRSTMNGSLF